MFATCLSGESIIADSGLDIHISMYCRHVLSLSLLSLLGGCVAKPASDLTIEPVSTQAVASPKTFVNSGQPASPVATDQLSFGDPQLAQLMDKALAGSPAYAQALSRIAKADALAANSRASLLPQVSANGSLSWAQQSLNEGYPPFFRDQFPHGLHSNSLVSLSALWNFDLWGRNRAALRAAKLDAKAAQLDGAEAHLMLIMSLLTAYTDFDRAVADEAAARAAADAEARTLALMTARYHAGLETASAVNAADAQAGTAQTQAIVSRGLVLITRYRLAALVGEGPDYGLTLKLPALVVPADDFGGVGVDVIAARPDVQASKARIDAAAARVQVAARDFYPNITLSALAGFQSLDTEQLFNHGSFIPSFGPAIHLPLFTAGALESTYRAQRADYNTAVAAYNETLLNALQDASSARVRLIGAQKLYADAQRSFADTQQDLMLAQERYGAKLISELPLLATQMALAKAQDTQETARANVVAAQVDLIRALGGQYAHATTPHIEVMKHG